jgi:hypothetical protein
MNKSDVRGTTLNLFEFRIRILLKFLELLE